MKNKNSKHENFKIDDEKISQLVRSVKYDLPSYVEDRLERTIANWGKDKKISRKWSLSWYPAAAALAAAIIIAALFIFQPFVKNSTETAPITEIRTEFELKDKNIKIIWFQKKDFELRRKKS